MTVDVWEGWDGGGGSGAVVIVVGGGWWVVMVAAVAAVVVGVAAPRAGSVMRAAYTAADRTWPR